jgi:hypothetical protein
MNTKTCENGHTMTGIGFDEGCPECEGKWVNTKEDWEEEFKWFLGSEELTNEVKNFIRETREPLLKEINNLKGEISELKEEIEKLEARK